MAKKKNAADRRREMKAQEKESRLKAAAQKDEKKALAAAEEKDAAREQGLAMVYKPAAQWKNIQPQAPVVVRVETFSPLHLGSGAADIHVDADVAQDEVGLPYFPAKRFKGLLYESALEVAEMSEASGLALFTKADLDALFQRGCAGRAQLVFSNLYMDGYEALHRDFAYLEKAYPSVFRPADVLNVYASLRYQTRIDRETGIAAATSLHNMRVLEAGVTFRGELVVEAGTRESLQILALAARNLSQSGGKRNRGFGRIGCTLEQAGKDILVPLVEAALMGEDAKGENLRCRR